MSNAFDTADRIFWLVTSSKNPVATASRAVSKVAFLARTPGRECLHSLVSALDEQKHGMVFEALGRRAQEPGIRRQSLDFASKHYAERDLRMADFKRATR